MSYTGRAITTALGTYFCMGDILTTIQTRFNCPFIPVSLVLPTGQYFFVVLVGNCEIVKAFLFVIYLPKSSGCCPTTHIFLQASCLFSS